MKAEVGDEPGCTGLVNNAGTTLPCPIEYLPLDGFRRQLEVNLVGPLAVTQALLPLLLRGRGRIVNVTSAAGKAGVPLMASYVAAKHGLEGLSDVLRLELGPLGVRVAVIEPGFVGTAMGESCSTRPRRPSAHCRSKGRRRYGGSSTRWHRRSARTQRTVHIPEVVAEEVLHALTSEKPRTRYPSGAGAKRMLFMRRILPDRRFDRIILRAGGLAGQR